MLKNSFLIFCLVLSLVGCISLQSTGIGGKGNAEWSLLSSSQIKSRLHSQYTLWRGVKYRLGSVSKSGIDCSGFVMVTYRDQFALNLPRTTGMQVRIGEGVRRSRLKPGDLVFFKTSFKTRHVGIFIGKGRFLHASTSRGVTISRLDDPYWYSRYWTARRI